MNVQSKLYVAGCDWMDTILVFGLIISSGFNIHSYKVACLSNAK